LKLLCTLLTNKALGRAVSPSPDAPAAPTWKQVEATQRTPKERTPSGFYNGSDGMTIADYFAIGVLIALTLWVAAQLLRQS